MNLQGRPIFRLPEANNIDQGYIFSSGVARNYSGCEVFGLIITPRCDIENAKVENYHYLPMVKFSDWKLRDFSHLFLQVISKSLKGRVKNGLEQAGLKDSMVGRIGIEALVKSIASKPIKENQKDSIVKKLRDHDACCSLAKADWPFTKESIQPFVDGYPKDLKALLSECLGNRRKGYYILEDWEEPGSFRVILLREIRSIQATVAWKIARGLDKKVSSGINLKENELDLSDHIPGAEIVSPVAVIQSPFMEHIVQQFFLNFGRIGIQDHEKGVLDHLINNF